MTILKKKHLVVWQVDDGQQLLHRVPGYQRLLEFSEEEFESASQHVDVLHLGQRGEVALVRLEPNGLDVAESAWVRVLQF